MNITFAKAGAALLLVSLLNGCAYQKMEQRQLLSTSEAIAAFQALGYGDWAANPFVRTEAVCGAQKLPVQFSEIKQAIFSLRQSKLNVFTDRKGVCSASYAFLLKDREDANRLVTAANSLGANVSYLFTTD